MSKATLEGLRSAKQKVQDRVAGHPNVIGWMIGAKVKGGAVTKADGITVLVSRKVPLADLDASEQIPATVTVGKKRIRIDVLQTGPLRKQSGTAFPAGSGLPISDGVETGTLSCLCRSSYGVFGLSCAHVLGGPDRDPTTASPIEVWSPTLSHYETAGFSALAVAGPGTGTHGQYGFVDAGIFTLSNGELAARARAAPALAVAGSVYLRQALTGRGAASAEPRSGQIIGIETTVESILTDLFIQAGGSGTFPGDSGLLWLNDAQEAVAIHAYGEQRPPGVGSAKTAAMMASRAAEVLAVELLRF